jgi:glycosyltransferase involved in cell wall biosynthesis
LKFLLTEVFPLLDADTISRLKLEVVGKSDADCAWTRAIMEMARPYPMVRFSGFVEDIRSAYRRNDLQVIASTQATGLRTRLIESWAFGMPVLATTVGASGVEHLAPGRNILIADDPRDYARNIKELLHHPERLDEIAVAARQTYEAYYSRRAVAAVLQKLLIKHFGL